MASRRKFLGKTGGFDGWKIGKSADAASLQETVESCKDANWQPFFMRNCTKLRALGEIASVSW